MKVRCIQRAWDRLRGKDIIAKNPVATHYGERFVYSGAESEALLGAVLQKDGPALVTRFGRTELKIVDWFMRRKNEPAVVFQKDRAAQIAANAGFINPSDRDLTRYACEFIRIVRDIDILAVWFVVNERELCLAYLPDRAQLVSLESLTPGPVCQRPWTRHLAGRRVLVIHPFEDTIRRQYANREKLFDNREVLPEFELSTLRAYQSLADNNPDGYASWFDALDAMKRKIDAVDFDVAVIGAGAYGMFLAHHCKAIGKKALHLGGAAQLLFGIKGKRWDDPTSEYGPLFYNEHWIRPLEHEIPAGSEQIENGCYW
ncbi:MAG: hypothetical protein LBJ46_00090 [Planctomycetota bacterium]|nr:hypothetical protein [Planctomycetota bacterium]